MNGNRVARDKEEDDKVHRAFRMRECLMSLQRGGGNGRRLRV